METSPTSSPLTALIVALALPLLAFSQNDDSGWDEFEASIESPAAASESEELATTAASQVKRTPFRRRIMREDVTIRIKNLRLESGGKVRFVYGYPKKAEAAPAVFVLDVETATLANTQKLFTPGASKREKQNYRDASYLLASPFGSHMLGNGFAVAYIVADDLETLRSARSADWIGVFNRVRDLKRVDPENVFLFSTREYANLSLYLSTQYRFSGFILEEPSYLLFSRNTYENVIENSRSLSAEEIWSRTDPTREFRYEQVLGRMSTPLLLIRNPRSTAYEFNEKTLIPKLLQVNASFETIEVPGTGRSLTVFGGAANSGVIEVSPEVQYNAITVTRWVDEIITYMRINSSVDPVALRDPSNYRTW